MKRLAVMYLAVMYELDDLLGREIYTNLPFNKVNCILWRPLLYEKFTKRVSISVHCYLLKLLAHLIKTNILQLALCVGDEHEKSSETAKEKQNPPQ